MALLFVSSLESTRPTEQGMEPYRRRYLRDGPIPERRDLWPGDEVARDREVGGPQQWNGGLLGSVLLVAVSIKGHALVSVLAVAYVAYVAPHLRCLVDVFCGLWTLWIGFDYLTVYNGPLRRLLDLIPFISSRCCSGEKCDSAMRRMPTRVISSSAAAVSHLHQSHNCLPISSVFLTLTTV